MEFFQSLYRLVTLNSPGNLLRLGIQNRYLHKLRIYLYYLLLIDPTTTTTIITENKLVTLFESKLIITSIFIFPVH